MEKKSLVQYVQDYQAIELELIENNGELSPTLDLMFSATSQEIAQKAESYKFVLDRLSHSTKYFREQADQNSRIARGLERAQEFLKGNLKAAMEIMETNEIVAGSVKAKLVKCSQKLVVDNEALVPKEYTEVITKVRPDALKAALESGVDVPGAHLEGGVALRFYANKDAK